MCRTEEEGVSGVDSAHVATAPSVSSKEGACRPLPLGPPTRRPRPRRPLTGARRAALVTLLCAAAAAIGASRGWYGASWWTNIGKGKDESAVDLFKERLNISTSGAESRQRRSWRRPIGGVFRRVFGGKDGNRKGHQQQQQQQQQRLAAAREEEENQQWRAHEEEALPPKKDAKRTSRKGRSEPSKDRDESASHPEGDPQESSPSTKRKRRALRSWWRRFLAKAGISVTKKVKRDGVVDAKARLVEELRKRLEQHPEELLPRAKAVLHELDDTMLLRYTWYLIYYFLVKHDNSR